jgi:acetyl esterase
MPLDPQFRTILDGLAAQGFTGLSAADPRTARIRFRALGESRRGPDHVPEAVAEIEDTTAHDVPVRVYWPLRDRGHAVVYLHGGGWALGGLDTHDPLARRMANELGAVVVSVDYRLAPEHPYPAGLDDAEAVFRWALDRFSGRPVGAAGDSAGGSLAAGLALRARDAQLPMAAQLLFYPCVDPGLGSASMTENGEGHFLTRADMAWFLEQYLPKEHLPDSGEKTTSPEIALLSADVRGVAPAVVTTAEFDPLRDEGDQLAHHLGAAGVRVEHLPGPGLIHGYASFFGVVDAAATACQHAFESFNLMLSDAMTAAGTYCEETSIPVRRP